MKLAIASGKGGTGKTTLSVALAQIADTPVQLLDLDVEEPNAKLFLKPQWTAQNTATVRVPVVNPAICSHCGTCSTFCQFNAIACLGSNTLVFPELCHSCGGCALLCPSQAITEQERPIGMVSQGMADTVSVAEGCLEVGHAMSPPLIRAVKHHTADEGLVILDCPPGTSCPMIAAVRDANVVLLVTEPTPFGLHDLTLAVETMRELGLPFAVAINRCDAGDDRVQRYCRRENIPVVLEIPDSRAIAEAYSRGISLVNAAPELISPLKNALDAVRHLP